MVIVMLMFKQHCARVLPWQHDSKFQFNAIKFLWMKCKSRNQMSRRHQIQQDHHLRLTQHVHQHHLIRQCHSIHEHHHFHFLHTSIKATMSNPSLHHHCSYKIIHLPMLLQDYLEWIRHYAFVDPLTHQVIKHYRMKQLIMLVWTKTKKEMVANLMLKSLRTIYIHLRMLGSNLWRK